MPLKKEPEIPKPSDEKKREKGDIEPILVPTTDDLLRTAWKVWFTETDSEVTYDPFLAKLTSVILKNL